MAGDFLDAEDGSRCPFLELLRALGEENFGRVADALFWSGLLLPGFLLQFHVKEPLVNLYARESCFLHCLLTHFAVPVASKLLKEVFEIVNLFNTFLFATHAVLDHRGRRASLIFALALSRNDWRYLCG